MVSRIDEDLKQIFNLNSYIPSEFAKICLSEQDEDKEGNKV